MPLETSDYASMGALAAVSGAFFSIWRVFDLVRKQGAETQKTCDRLTRLEDSMSERMQMSKKIFSKLEAMSQEIHEMKLQSAKDHGNITAQIIRLDERMKNLEERSK